MHSDLRDQIALKCPSRGRNKEASLDHQSQREWRRKLSYRSRRKEEKKRKKSPCSNKAQWPLMSSSISTLGCWKTKASCSIKQLTSSAGHPHPLTTPLTNCRSRRRRNSSIGHKVSLTLITTRYPNGHPAEELLPSLAPIIPHSPRPLATISTDRTSSTSTHALG